MAHLYAVIGAFRSSLLLRLLRGVPLIVNFESRILEQIISIENVMRFYEGKPSNNWNTNENRNAPIAAYQHATNM